MNLLALLKRPKRPNQDGDLPDLAGKVVVIYPNLDAIGGCLFQDAKVVRIGFNEFVVGRRVGLEPPWQEALVTGYCLDIDSSDRPDGDL